MKSLLEHIKARCTVDDAGCWLWAGAINRCSTPVMNTKATGFKSVRAVLWALCGRKTRAGHVFVSPACHALCVNPEHQTHCSPATRHRMAAADGRLSSGALHSLRMLPAARSRAHVKLNWERVRRMRAEYAQHGNAARIAREYGISHSHAHRVCTGVWWRETTPFDGLRGRGE